MYIVSCLVSGSYLEVRPTTWGSKSIRSKRHRPQPNTQALMQLGGAYAPAVRLVRGYTSVFQTTLLTPLTRDLQLWRVVTPVFLHANLLHLAFNLLFILVWPFAFSLLPRSSSRLCSTWV
ncbi:rhomboid protease rom3 [Cystoisospora suis]|uniref:Rhomboid protease rom3 n=1 Tax=Cystoisospora suis TaxID=483139 RepID=A0A2C6L563_9APIC|nr:rhomboid protease rom3 [Cystoisospora suis]